MMRRSSNFLRNYSKRGLLHYQNIIFGIIITFLNSLMIVMIMKNGERLVQKNLLDFLMSENEITWQSIILDLIKTGNLDPWNIDISLLSNKYLEKIRELQVSNLFISGKVLLASAMLLKFKADKLLDEGIGYLDNLMFPPEDVEDLSQFMDNNKRISLDADPRLTIKTPQARKKKVSVNELIAALEKALEVNDRRLLKFADRNRIPENLKIPENVVDIEQVINDLYRRIQQLFVNKPLLLFSELVPSGVKKDKIFTFVPLLHLSNHAKVDMDQKEHFGEIYIKNSVINDQ